MTTTLELLPTWEECDRTIKQLGPQGASALMKFVYEYEPPQAGTSSAREHQFREMLSALIDEVAGVAINKHYALPFTERAEIVRGLRK